MSSSNSIQLNYLVFDDENEEKAQNLLRVKIPGVICNVIFINPLEFYNPEDDTFNAAAFEQQINEETKGYYISLVATDWNMLHETKNYKEVNGLQIIELLLTINEKYRKCPFLIYSGKPNEASNVLISKIKAELSDNPKEPIYSLQLLSLLLELRLKFCVRGTRFDEIVALIKGEKTISTIVLNSLTKFDSNLVINTGNDQFDGRTVESLISLISGNDDKGLKFIREFIELSIANYTKLNVE